MKYRFFSRFTLHSLIAMLLSWLLSSSLAVFFHGTGEFSEIVSWAAVVLSFVIVLWVLFVFPFIKYFNRILAHATARIYFPLFSTFYALLIFALFFGITMQSLNFVVSIFKGMNILAITAALIGGFWGVFYQLLYMFERRRAYVG